MNETMAIQTIQSVVPFLHRVRFPYHMSSPAGGSVIQPNEYSASSKITLRTIAPDIFLDTSKVKQFIDHNIDETNAVD